MYDMHSVMWMWMRVCVWINVYLSKRMSVYICKCVCVRVRVCVYLNVNFGILSYIFVCFAVLGKYFTIYQYRVILSDLQVAVAGMFLFTLFLCYSFL